MIEVPIYEKLNLTIQEAAAYSNIGEKKLREIAQRPDCPFALRKSGHILIKRKQLEIYNDTTKEIK